MRIATAPPIHLSNREVLDHFLSLKKDSDILQSLIATRSARSSAKAREQYPLKVDDKEPEVEFGEESAEEDVAERRGLSTELVWVQDQVIHYLCSEHNSTARQTDEGVARLANELQDHDLTKGEVLQICNLAPVLPVELYCIIEEPDDRFHPDAQARLDEIANQVQSTLLDTFPPELEAYGLTSRSAHHNGEDGVAWGQVTVGAAMGAEQEFVHEAEYGADREDGVGEEKEGEMD